MTLDEVVGRLPNGHVARREFEILKRRVLETSKKERRSERVQVASRVLAAMWESEVHLHPTTVAKEAVEYADALLARIDETEEK